MFATGFVNISFSQTIDSSLIKKVDKLEDDVKKLKYLNIYGYAQTQFQIADSVGIESYSGGNFAANTDKRFTIRRGRLRAVYDNGIMMFDMQIQGSERGYQLMNLYGRFTEQKLKAFSVTMGMFNKPFGYEIPFTSRDRESPERGRMSQILFPNERDQGGMLTFQMPKTSKLHFLKIQGGMFNGTGTLYGDFDKKKDFIGQVILAKKFMKEELSLSGGFSYYNGGMKITNKFIYSDVTALDNGNTGFSVDSSATNAGSYVSKKYMGADLQISLHSGLGKTTLRGEFITGLQPGTSSSTKLIDQLPSATTPIYLRNFNGAYFAFAQKIGKSFHQIAAKYDWYDPNTDLAGDEIGKSGTSTGAADIKYTTLGFGYIYDWKVNVRLMLWYDLVNNETSTNLTGYKSDIKDNVFTFRIQYRFN